MLYLVLLLVFLLMSMLGIAQIGDNGDSAHYNVVLGLAVIDILKRVESVFIYYMNAKAITVNELYGTMDVQTREWKDGLLSKVFRTANEKPADKDKEELRWILFDGDVDAIWVENMNSVMDDNRLLTLINGDRIRLERFCKMLYEVYDLQYASPATISRCGMVYVDPKDLGDKPYFERWISKFGGEKKEQNEVLIESFD